MRLRSFGTIGVAAAVAVACGGAGSGAGGTFGGGTQQPPSSSDTPTSSNTAPSNPNQPTNNTTPLGGGGALCSSVCSLAGKYPCVDLPTSQTDCMTYCQDALANGADKTTPECAQASVDMILCADANGDLSCTDNGLEISQKAGTDCPNEIAAYAPCIQVSTQSCQTGVDCSGCQGDCEKCQCQNGPGTACDSVCNGTPNGGTCTMAGDQCAGCADNCSSCMCVTNNNATQCASACGG